MNFRILQLKDVHVPYAFRDYDDALTHGFNVGDYRTVWEGRINVVDTPDDVVLELIYHKFNVNHPIGYVGRSLSVSDIVILEDSRAYYCCDAGWKLLDSTVLEESDGSESGGYDA